MKYPRYDFYALESAVSFGARPMLGSDESDDKWEVYVKLSNGNSLVAAKDGTREQAKRALTRIVRRVGHIKQHLLVTTDDNFVDALFILRVYLDGEGNDHVVMAEDITGESHCLVTGDREKCRKTVRDVAALITNLHDMVDKGDELNE